MGPEYAIQLISPLAFLFVEPLFEAVKNSFICCFYLTIALWISRIRFAQSDFLFCGEVFKQSQGELETVVCDNLVWQYMAIDDEFLYKCLYVLGTYFLVRLSFDPLGEIVGHYKQATLMARLGSGPTMFMPNA